jgi:hypothetical protein
MYSSTDSILTFSFKYNSNLASFSACYFLGSTFLAAGGLVLLILAYSINLSSSAFSASSSSLII